jgi:hypothetical protein
MSHAEFSLKYDGSAVDAGTMDVRDLSPALLAAGQLIEAANRVVNGDNSAVKVRIKTTSPGSFLIIFDIDLSFVKSITDILAGPEATAAANLVTYLTAGISAPIGAIHLVKWLRGKRPTSIKKGHRNLVTVEIDGKTIEVDEPVARLALDLNVRLSLERVVAEPLSKEGYDTVAIGSGRAVEEITKSEGYYFLAPPEREDGVFESRYRGPFSIVSLSFKSGNKWRLHDGKSTLNATVVDEDFLAKVNNNEVSFSKGDLLICDVRVVTQNVGGQLKAEYFIERVLEHRHIEPHAELFPDTSHEENEISPSTKNLEPPMTA